MEVLDLKELKVQLEHKVQPALQEQMEHQE
jgi:hypothetical protein